MKNFDDFIKNPDIDQMLTNLRLQLISGIKNNKLKEDITNAGLERIICDELMGFISGYVKTLLREYHKWLQSDF
jgi:hypothetical protein